MLPPSFNANEIYDPIREASVPFTFPFSETSFQSMPIGSIRSFALQGGVEIPFLLNTPAGQILLDKLKSQNINFQIPYQIFIQGEFRINVLRKEKKAVRLLKKKRLKNKRFARSPLLS